MQSPESLGRFQIERELGRGAMGVVYLAEDPVLERPVALRVIRVHSGISQDHLEELRQRCVNEARSAANLSHPNIVTVYDAGFEGDSLFIAMEYVEGESLEQVVESKRVLALEEMSDLALQLAGALDHAHEQGIVHRDIKPANVLIDRRGRLKISDFGVARQAASTLTAAGTIIGTPAYMSPEQITGHPVTGAADQFSLGVVLYELLTGSKPFQGEDATTVLYKIVHEQPVAPITIRTSLPSAVGAVILRALAKEPSERYATCAELAEALRAALRAAPASASDLLASGATARVDTASDATSRAADAQTHIGGAGAAKAPSRPATRMRPAALPLNLPTMLSAGAAVILVVLGLSWVLGVWEAEPGALAPELDRDTEVLVVDDDAADPAQRFPASESFRIVSLPEGAQVTLDGRVLAERAPVDVDLDPYARHTLLLELSGRESVAWTFVPEELPENQRRTGELFFPLREIGTLAAVRPVPELPRVADAETRDEPRLRVPFEPYDPIKWRPGRDVGPVAVTRVEPEFPAWAAAAGLQRYVILEAVIDKRGRVRDARVIQPVHPDLERLAQEAIFGWRFTPAQQDGDESRPIDVYHNVTVAFREGADGSGSS